MTLSAQAWTASVIKPAEFGLQIAWILKVFKLDVFLASVLFPQSEWKTA